MADPSLFPSSRQARWPTVHNEAGGRGYALEPIDRLAQYALTGCLGQTFYATAATQRDTVLALAAEVEPAWLARIAIYAREQGFMKDLPALLCAVLAVRGPELLPVTFERVIDNGRMLRTFVQILRSGVVGRRSLGSMPRRLVRAWMAERSDAALAAASVGTAPSLADIVRMVHPKPTTASRSALFAWLCGRDYSPDDLPEPLRSFEAWKAGDRSTVPDVPFAMLTAQTLSSSEWRVIAARAPWQTTRMNLNTFARHGVFDDLELTAVIADRLRDPIEIRRSRVFPYQLMMAHCNSTAAVPPQVRAALGDAMERATDNVPELPGQVFVAVDVSGSMHAPVSGVRRGATSKARCLDVAALFAASLVRRNPTAEVIPFAETIRHTRLDPRASVLANADRLAREPGGGTDCSVVLRELVRRKRRGDLVVLVSDNESWIRPGNRQSTPTMDAWQRFKRRNPAARMVCIDIQPFATVQVPPDVDVLHVGGFSDDVFSVVRSFATAGSDPHSWRNTIQSAVAV
ncbi:MAG: RNA-binding protein [Planctomycetes bacterium]|nr:RNA-binding protein [Planctomycetota bacterium]